MPIIVTKHEPPSPPIVDHTIDAWFINNREIVTPAHLVFDTRDDRYGRPIGRVHHHLTDQPRNREAYTCDPITSAQPLRYAAHFHVAPGWGSVNGPGNMTEQAAALIAVAVRDQHNTAGGLGMVGLWEPEANRLTLFAIVPVDDETRLLQPFPGR